MFLSQIEKTNVSLRRTKKAIITLGCSFVQGQGALGDDFYNTYKWYANLENPFSDVRWEFSNDDLKKINTQHPDINIDPSGSVPLAGIEYQNAFAEILAQKYLNNEYTALNFGLAGKGNRATIKELHYYPSLEWNEIEECIVIYCPSGAERFDFVDDQTMGPNDHNRWIAMWPNELPQPGTSRAKLWLGYKNSIYSTKFEILEQIAQMQELLLWCAYKKAKLIIVPAFQRTYTRQYFSDCLQTKITRNNETGEIQDETPISFNEHIARTLRMWPWKNMFKPDNCASFADLVMKQEFPDNYKDLWFYNYMGTGTPNLWITPCAHPNAKGHDIFANNLYKEITTNLDQYSVKYR